MCVCTRADGLACEGQRVCPLPDSSLDGGGGGGGGGGGVEGLRGVFLRVYITVISVSARGWLD